MIGRILLAAILAIGIAAFAKPVSDRINRDFDLTSCSLETSQTRDACILIERD